MLDGTPDNDTADEHLICPFDYITMTGYTISHMMMMKLTRIAAAGDDSYDLVDVRLLEFDVHIEQDWPLGSAYEFIKDD